MSKPVLFQTDSGSSVFLGGLCSLTKPECEVTGFILLLVVLLSVPQGAAGDHLPSRQHSEEPWHPEGRQGGHLYASVTTGGGSHVGVRPYRSGAHRGVCRLQLGGSGREDPGR